MRPKHLEKLIELFTRFPGIGARQAARFAYWLADEPDSIRQELSRAVAALSDVRRCPDCFRLLEAEAKCGFCGDERRDAARLAVVEKDLNCDALERSGVYDGRYFILGGTLSEFGEATADHRFRLRTLFERIKKSATVSEIILAFNATPEGHFTARYIERILEPLQKARGFKITRLGRGISTGAEIEYLNRDTLKDAFDNRR